MVGAGVPRMINSEEPTVRIIDSSDDEEVEEDDDIELLVDWRGNPLPKTSSSSKRKRKRNNSCNGTPTSKPAQLDPETCRKISYDDDSFLVILDNTPKPSATTQRTNKRETETMFAEGSTPSIVLDTPISAQLKNSNDPTLFIGDFSLKESENESSFHRRLNKCSDGTGVICLDSDNESDRFVSSALKEVKPILDTFIPCKLEELQETDPSVGDSIHFLGKSLNSEEGVKNQNSEEDQLAMLEMEFVDNSHKKVTSESISKASAHGFTKEAHLYKAKEKTNALEATTSEVFHLNNNENGPTVKSVGTNSELRESIIASTGCENFLVLEFACNIRDMDWIESGSRKIETSNCVVNSTGVSQNGCGEGPLLDRYYSPMCMNSDGINYTTGNAEIGKDNELEHNSITGAVEQQVHGIKGRKRREEDKSQDKTENLAPKEIGNKRQRKDRELIRKEKEEERKCKQEEIARNKREKEEEKQRQKEEKRQKMEEEKIRKASAKAKAAEMRKRQKEMEKWEKGKFALKSISAQIDTKVIERGLIGGHLLSRLAEKELSFRIVSNQVQSSILWKMNVPDADAQSSFKECEIPYVLIVLEAEEFCNMVSEGSLTDHVHNIQRLYPGYIICYLANKLVSYINKREQEQYKNPGSASCWRRPPVEQALAKFVTHFVGVRSRLCLDEAEVADHIVGLTRSLAECQFRRKLTRLSTSANGAHVPKDYSNKEMIKRSVWLKALIAIPKLPPKCAVAIAKKYPTMRSLLNVYLDPNKTIHEKEFLLQDLVTEGLLMEGGRRLGPVCSKRVYRILMAQSGNLKTDDVEEGADLFQT